MFYRFFYITWRIFWNSLAVLILTVCLFAGSVFLFFQTRTAKEYLSHRAEKWFAENFHGELSIGKISGMLPFHFKADDVLVSFEGRECLTVSSLYLRFDPFSLFAREFYFYEGLIENPEIYFNPAESGKWSMGMALKRRKDDDSHSSLSLQALPVNKIVFQQFKISDGAIASIGAPEHPSLSFFPDSLRIHQLSTHLFLDISLDQQYVEIEHFRMSVEEMEEWDLSLSGQVFHHDGLLELNAMKTGFGNSNFFWAGEIPDINLLEEPLFSGFGHRPWSLFLEESFVSGRDVQKVFPKLNNSFSGFTLSFEAEGRGDTLKWRDAAFHTEKSTFLFEGEATPFGGRSSFGYDLTIKELAVNDEELQLFIPQMGGLPFQDWGALSAAGSIGGTSDTLQAAIRFQLPEGNLNVTGGVSLQSSHELFIALEGKEINLAAFEGLGDYPSILNTKINLKGRDFFNHSPVVDLDLKIEDSEVSAFSLPKFHIKADYADQKASYSFIYAQEKDDQGILEGRGAINLQSDMPHLILRGRSSDFNLEKVASDRSLPESKWNISYDINWHGVDIDGSYGRVVMDVAPSVLNGKTLRPHQMYFDLNRPEEKKRSMRLTSTIADVIMEGSVEVSSVTRLFRHWKAFLTHRINEEILFNPAEEPLQPIAYYEDFIQAELMIELKDTELLQAYIPQIPVIESNANLLVALNMDRYNLDIRTEWRDSKSEWNGIVIGPSRMKWIAGFDFDDDLRNAFQFDIDLEIEEAFVQDHQLNQIDWVFRFDENGLKSRQQIASFGKEIRFFSELNGRILDSGIQFEITGFEIGNKRYMWHASGLPKLNYDKKGNWSIEDFLLESEGDRIAVDGGLSTLKEDSLMVQINDVSLCRISDMIGGRVDFDGTLHAEFLTKGLRNKPEMSGFVHIDHLAFHDRIIGEVNLETRYNHEKKQYDTRLEIFTDEEKYADYIERNNGIRQNVLAEGWFKTPGANEPSDTLYYFDVDAKEVDTWVLIYLLGSIFESVEGRAEGNGTIAGNYNHIDFQGDFYISEGEVVPIFFETLYSVSGDLSVSRENGVELHELNATDQNGGVGSVTGVFDFNEFQAERFMNFTLEMDNLLFLNNSSGPEVLFYGAVAGTGTVNISGSNLSPFVRTIEPVRTTRQSRLSIPLAEQGMSDERHRFILFVDDFKDIDLQRKISETPEMLQDMDRSFMEVFRLDLQFIATENSTVQLIFDPVTGDIVNARGEGRVRITLEDETLQIFGNFDILGGDYLFVGGDIISRRFILREGGTIRWEGDPVNALLDITAVFRSRPNISPLLGAEAGPVNRIPVELLLEITGPLDNIENDFYFDFPNAIDATQNATVLNILNSEEQKLIQATSLLFTGGFISGALVGDTQTQELAGSLQSRAGQVGISQLLSSQINALLSDNLLNLDVDINLLGFDQADIGIALRLFDDRLVLRREGEVGGEEANIGDLGATYRINRNLSVEAFHRKDPMLVSILGTQAEVENVNGIGLEAQFRFNSWKDFGNKAWRNITTLFGLINREKE